MAQSAELRIEHVLAVVSGGSPGAGIPFGWTHRISDTYRLWALRAVFAGLSGQVLDYGCGDKKYEPALRHPRVAGWIGVDLPQRTSGAGHANRADLFIDAATGRIPVESGQIDVVLATQVLEHVEDLDRVLAEMHRVLRPGGVLVATCPLVSPLHEEPFDFRRFTPYGMRVHGLPHGLVLERAIALGGPIATLFTLAAMYANPLARIPLFGKALHRLYVEFLTRAGGALERLAFGFGFKQCTVCFDYLFVLRRSPLT